MTEQEFPCAWTCPKCKTFQHDSVNPELGPFVTCTCTECGRSFDDGDLDAESVASWENARQQAEAAAEGDGQDRESYSDDQDRESYTVG